MRISDWSSDVCSSDLGPFFAHIALPTLTLSVIFIALIARMTRASAIEVLQEDYVRTAYAKGQNERVILIRHVPATCTVPLVTVTCIGNTLLTAGVVVTERV